MKQKNVQEILDEVFVAFENKNEKYHAVALVEDGSEIRAIIDGDTDKVMQMLILAYINMGRDDLNMSRTDLLKKIMHSIHAEYENHNREMSHLYRTRSLNSMN